jgi:hypothetical protein
MKVRDLLRGSLISLGVIAPGETPSAAELADALSRLNAMTDSWSLEKLLIHSINRQIFDLVGGQQNYTLGIGANFNSARPVAIDKAGLLFDNPANELPIDTMNVDQWSEVTVKNLSSTYPARLYVEETMPFMNLIFWPVPSEAAKVALYMREVLTQFNSVNDDVIFPPGYYLALESNFGSAGKNEGRN